MSTRELFASQLACIPERHHSLFLPQLEQLEAEPSPVRYGLLGRVGADAGDGWFWFCSPADDIAVTVVNMVARRDIPLRETPQVRYSVVGLMCRSSAQMMNQIWAQQRQGAGGMLRAAPVVPGPASERGELSAFWMDPRAYEFAMKRGTAHYSASVHFLPEFFERMEREGFGDLAGMPAALDAHPDLAGAYELRALLRQLTPHHAGEPGARLRYLGLALQVAAAFNAHCLRPGAAVHAGPGELAAQACALMADSLDRPLSTSELAEALHVSRTRLYDVFERERGIPVRAYQERLRMQRAKELLEFGDDPIAGIARKVGYAHHSTFAAAFKRATGTTPAQWRAAHARA